MSRKIKYYVIAMKSREKENIFFYTVLESQMMVTDDITKALKFNDNHKAKRLIKNMKLNKNGINCEVLSDLDLSIRGFTKQIREEDKIYCIIDEDTKQWVKFDEESKEYVFTTEPHLASLWAKADGQGLVNNRDIIFPNKNVSLQVYDKTIN